MPKQALVLISEFLEDVHHRHSLHNTKNPSDKTTCGYMTSAAEASKALTGMMVPLFEDPKDGEQTRLKSANCSQPFESTSELEANKTEA
jgi:hypothetical protein